MKRERGKRRYGKGKRQKGLGGKRVQGTP